ncbi:MAG: RsmE family RNA methyltransferase [Candidatus Omnitrophica bacterium]|nr:RsmE family RNA methyltransferase [Candidatus Omnitrophota bacterium]
MNRFYCKFSDIQGNKIKICELKELHHLKDVLRFKAGEKAAIFDDQGNEYSVKLQNLSATEAEFLVMEKKSRSNLPETQIVIACAIPKKSKIDDIIDKLTQLGVDRIIPLITERVIVKLDEDKGLRRHKRWVNIALTASKQSQRNSVPVVDPATDFKELIDHSGEFDLKLIPNLIGERKALKEVFGKTKPKKVLVLIGPEGDFTDKEIAAANQAGFIPVTFGDQVFRVETACLYIASILTYELNH